MRPKETRKYSSYNRGTRVDVEGGGRYRSLTIRCSSHNQGENGILLNLSEDTVVGDGGYGYRYQTIHSSSQRGDSRYDSARNGSRSEDINHSSLLNVGESVDGNSISVSRSRTSPSPSHNSGDHRRPSSVYSYGDNRSGNRSHTSQFSAYNHGIINFFHQRFHQETIPRGVPGENIYQNNPYNSYPSIPKHPHQIIPHHLYPSITPHQSCLCTDCTSTPTYKTYVVPNYPHILPLDYLHT